MTIRMETSCDSSDLPCSFYLRRSCDLKTCWCLHSYLRNCQENEILILPLLCVQSILCTLLTLFYLWSNFDSMYYHYVVWLKFLYFELSVCVELPFMIPDHTRKAKVVSINISRPFSTGFFNSSNGVTHSVIFLLPETAVMKCALERYE